jgi:hypothetical protein
MSKFNKLSRAEMKKVTGGVDCGTGRFGQCCTCSGSNGPIYLSNMGNCTCDYYCQSLGYTAGFTDCPIH